MNIALPDCAPRQENAAPKLLLLGLGNDLLTDDGVGLRVVAALQAAFEDRKDIAFTASSEMGLALLDLVAGFESLIIVDSVQTKTAPPGTVHELDGEDLVQGALLSPHFLGIGEILALGRELGLVVPRLVKVFAIETEDPFTVGADLTPALNACLPQIVDRIRTSLQTSATQRTLASE